MEGFNADKNYPRKDKDKRVHRRFLYSFIHRVKYGLNRSDQVEYLVQKLLMKEIYFEEYCFPLLMRESLIKKLKRYFEVKENYKVD